MERWPAAHDGLLAFVAEHTLTGSYCDLGCGVGQLGERLAADYAQCFGIDRRADKIEEARARGITMRIEHVEVGPETLDTMAALLEEAQAGAVVTRHALCVMLIERTPERWQTVPWAAQLGDAIARAGVRQIFAEGLAPVNGRQAYPIGDVTNELATLGPRWKVTETRGATLALASVVE